MKSERRFLYRGAAVPIGGRISRPRELVIDAGGASALTVIGGRSRGQLGRMRFGEFASIRSASTSAEGLFDDRRQVIELTHGRIREDSLTGTSVVSADVRQVVVGVKPALRVEQIRATLVGHTPGATGEAAIKTSDLKISGVDIGGHGLIVVLDTDIFDKHDTRSKLLAALDKPAFIREKGATLLMSGFARGERLRGPTIGDGMIYASVVREIRWKGKPYPGATIDRNLVTVPDFGRIYFGEIFISKLSRRLTMLRLALGSPFGGAMAAGEVETNGGWYPP